MIYDSDSKEIEKFKDYLINKGYSSSKPSAPTRSTVNDYCYWIARICRDEDISINELSININKYISMYDKGGPKEKVGNKSHSTLMNALRRFKEYIQ